MGVLLTGSVLGPEFSETANSHPAVSQRTWILCKDCCRENNITPTHEMSMCIRNMALLSITLAVYMGPGTLGPGTWNLSLGNLSGPTVEGLEDF